MRYIAGKLYPETWAELGMVLLAIVVLLGFSVTVDNASEISQIILGN